MLTKLKTIRSHVGLARFLAECEGDPEVPVGYLARAQVADIPSPYRYSSTVPIDLWNGKLIVWFEVAHKKYEIYEVPANFMKFVRQEAAEDWNFKYSKKGT